MVETASDVEVLGPMPSPETNRRRMGNGSPSSQPGTVQGSTSKAKLGWAGVKRPDFDQGL